MRRGLGWLLAIVLALTAVVLWMPQRAATIVQAIDARPSFINPVAFQAADSAPLLRLPTLLEPINLEPARRDPFVDRPPAPPSPQPPAAAPAPLPSPQPAPTPPPPPLQWQLLGTMDSPAGKQLVLLVHTSTQQTLLAEPGLRLDGGYEVVSIQADAVRLVYPPTQAEVVIPISPPPVSNR
jgi:hypothetical protein